MTISNWYYEKKEEITHEDKIYQDYICNLFIIFSIEYFNITRNLINYLIMIVMITFFISFRQLLKNLNIIFINILN